MLGAIPFSALFILFDFVIHNPSHPETEANLALLDMASGYFGRLQYATGGSFPSFLMSGFSQIATEFVRKMQAQSHAEALPTEPADNVAPIPAANIETVPFPADDSQYGEQHVILNPYCLVTGADGDRASHGWLFGSD
jgi:hypothetical protein